MGLCVALGGVCDPCDGEIACVWGGGEVEKGRESDGGWGGNVLGQKLPGGGCVGGHATAGDFGVVRRGFDCGNGCEGAGCEMAKMGGGGGGGGGVVCVMLIANPIGPMGLVNCPLFGNMIKNCSYLLSNVKSSTA